jgi:hypothetical protein
MYGSLKGRTMTESKKFEDQVETGTGQSRVGPRLNLGSLGIK